MSKPPIKPTENPTRILVLGDSVVPGQPGQSITGFGRVLLNLFSRFPACPVDFWAINFGGYGYKPVLEKFPHWTLIPAGYQGWNTPARLAAFLRQLEHGNYTHVFILMDPDAISSGTFPAELKRICRTKKIRSLLYYPVDAATLEAPYEIIEVVDCAVAFTDCGRTATRKAIGRSLFPIEVVPHGIDVHFTPLTPAERQKNRNEFQVDDGKNGMKPFVKENDFLILNVNKNEWRKDPLRSLEILKGLRDVGVPAKLIMRMDPVSQNAGVHLERAAAQLGLTLDKDWAHIGPVPEEHLRGLYGAADLVLSTSLGEGWGFSMTEALGCGTPVAVPDHTSLGEIAARITDGGAPAVCRLALADDFVMGYDTRLRRRVALAAAVEKIKSVWMISLVESIRGQLSPETCHWLSWDRVAKEFLKLMGITITPCPATNLRVELTFSVQEKHTVNQTNNSMPLKLTTTQQSVVTAKFETAAGVVVPIAGKPQWAADPAVVLLTPSDDGLSVVVASVGVGKTTLTVTGEGDPSPGVDTVSTTLDIEVVNPEASQVVLDVGAPTEKPAAASAAAPGA